MIRVVLQKGRRKGEQEGKLGMVLFLRGWLGSICGDLQEKIEPSRLFRPGKNRTVPIISSDYFPGGISVYFSFDFP